MLKTPNYTLFLAGGYASGLTTKCITMEGISVRQLSSTQLEADTCMLLYAIDFDRRMSSKNVTGRLVVQSPDTDVMILLILYMQQMEAVQDLWMETGTITRTLDLRRLIPIHKIADKVGPVVCNTLPGVDALTSCDAVSSLFGVGKQTVWQLAMELPSSELSGLDDLGGDDVTKATGAAKGFVVKMYDRTN